MGTRPTSFVFRNVVVVYSWRVFAGSGVLLEVGSSLLIVSKNKHAARPPIFSSFRPPARPHDGENRAARFDGRPAGRRVGGERRDAPAEREQPSFLPPSPAHVRRPPARRLHSCPPRVHFEFRRSTAAGEEVGGLFVLLFTTFECASGRPLATWTRLFVADPPTRSANKPNGRRPKIGTGTGGLIAFVHARPFVELPRRRSACSIQIGGISARRARAGARFPHGRLVISRPFRPVSSSARFRRHSSSRKVRAPRAVRPLRAPAPNARLR